MEYERKPDAIYDQSFSIIQSECDLTRFNDVERVIAVRMIHACGDTSIAPHISISPDAVARFSKWWQKPARVICDVNMVKMGVINRYLPANTDLLSAIDQPNLDMIAREIGNTRTAAGTHQLKDKFKHSVVIIGNAPTALFHLIELLDQGFTAPDLIIGCPVGFVGAVESKDALITAKYTNPSLAQTGVISLKGRLGGSAIASSAINALCKNFSENVCDKQSAEGVA